MAEKQLHKMMGALVELQSSFGGLTTEERQLVIKETPQVIESLVKEIKKYRLRKIFQPVFTNKIFTIEALDGASIDEVEEVFAGGIDPDIKRWGLDLPDGPTDKIRPEIYELKTDFSFSGDWDKFFSWRQAVRLCAKYPELFSDGYSALFPLKKGEECFVARVNAGSDGLSIRARVRVHRFERDRVWAAECRYHVVVPQSLVP